MHSPQVSTIKDVLIALSAGKYHSCALTQDRKVYSWGEGMFGRLGHGTSESMLVPKLISGDTMGKAGY